MAYNGYEDLAPYGNYGDSDGLTPYELLMQMKSWNKAIYLTIENSDKEIRSELSIVDERITARVDNFEENTTAQFNVMSGEINSKVAKTDYNGNTIASLIQQTPTAVNVIAQALNLSGYVTFSSLTASGTTQIDGSRITTGYISAARLDASVILAKVIAAGGISADYVTAGTIRSVTISSAIINGGQINAVDIDTRRDIYVGRNITMQGSSGGRISLPYSGCQLVIDSGGNVTLEAYNDLDLVGADIYLHGEVHFMGDVNGVALSDTTGLGFGYSSTSNRLYVRINGSNRGYVDLV